MQPQARPQPDNRSLHIVARDREQQSLRAHLDATLEGSGGLVLLSGEAGIGKTALIQDFTDHAVERGALVLSGGCYDLTTTPPYGPWNETLVGYPPGEERPSVPPSFDNPAEPGQAGSQAALFEELRQFFVELSRLQPVIIILEDLHWSDLVSLDLLRYLSRRLVESAFLIVATYRDDEITRRHDLYQLLPVLVRENRAERIHLNPLDTVAVQDLIRSRYDLADIDTVRLADHVMQRSEGNPLFAGEILHGLEDARLLHFSDEGWVVNNLDQARVPSLLQQLIESRVSRLSPVTRDALRVAAVIGHAIPLDLWQEVASLRGMELDQVIAESLESSLLEETRDRAGLQFRHALLRESLYDSLILSRRRALHGEVGQALAKTPAADPDAVAHHFQQAGDSRAVEWLIKAGWRAERKFAMQIALRHYEMAETYLEARPDALHARGWLRFHCGIVMRFVNRKHGMALLEDAMRIAARVGDPVLAAHCLAIHGMLHAWGGELGPALTESEEARDALSRTSKHDLSLAWAVITSLYPASIYSDYPTSLGHPLFRVAALPEVNILTQAIAYWLPVAGYFQRTIDEVKPYVAEVRAGTNDELTVHALCRFVYSALANSCDMLGDPDAGRAWRKLELTASELFGDYANITSSRNQELTNLITFHTEQVPQRLPIAHAAIAAASRIGIGLDQGITDLQIFGTPVDYLEGRWTQARSILESTWTLMTSSRSQWAILLARLAREQGEPEIAWARVGEILPGGQATKPGTVEYFSAVNAQQLTINLLLDAGDRDQALKWLETHDRWLEWSGAILGRAERALLWARFHQLTGDNQLAHQSAVRALSNASQPRQPLALIAAHRLLGEIALVVKRFTESHEHLRESLELAEVCAAPYEQALTLLTMARLDAATGKIDDAWQKVDQARSICTPLSAVPALQQATAIAATLAVRRGHSTHPAGLSPREAEVLGLVAQGLTDAQVAEQLFISPRTVGVHLSSIYNKLGVSSRVEATRFAVTHGLDGPLQKRPT
jgi:DNA-binding CsgD family transcriptional regulator